MSHEFSARRLTTTLFLGQALTSAAVIASATVSSIAGAQLSGEAALAGVPSTFSLVGGALAAYPAARFMERWGRRAGLSLGYAIGIVGAIIASASIFLHSFVVFLLGLFVIGAARGITELSRYAAAEIVVPEQRGQAISVIVLAGTVGAVFGPIIVGPAGQLAELAGANSLVGPWLGSTLLFVLAFGIVFLFLRPDPVDIARQMAAGEPEPPGGRARARASSEVFRSTPVRVAVLAMGLGQAVMVMLMAITSLHMTDHNHGLGDVSLVISAHTLGMFGLSVVTGRVVDRIGSARAIGAGAVVLVAASLLAPVSQLTAVIALALFLLGLGWNLCYVAGSSLLSAAVTPEERGSAQGTADLVVNLTSAVSTLGSGVVFALIGYAAMGLVCAAVAFVTLSLSGWYSRSLRTLHTERVEA